MSVKGIELLKPDRLYYLASPYSDPDPQVRLGRYKAAMAACALLLRHGRKVVSPIVHNHNLACEHEFAPGFEQWSEWDLTLLNKCDGLIVLALFDWEKSKGVMAELHYWKKAGGVREILLASPLIEPGEKLSISRYEYWPANSRGAVNSRGTHASEHHQ